MTTTLIVSLVGSLISSSIVAALVTTLMSDRNDRRKQLRDARTAVAGEFAGDAMTALACLLDYRPTDEEGHRNEQLHFDASLRQARANAVDEVVNRLRALRGRLWILFPGRTPHDRDAPNEDWTAHTTADWADKVVTRVREMQRACEGFWADAAKLAAAEGDAEWANSKRRRLEEKFNYRYFAAKETAWIAVEEFTKHAYEAIDNP